MRKVFLSCFLGMLGVYISAGTLLFKDGKKITNIEINSISEGRVVFEKEGKLMSVGIGKIEGYYKSDLKNAEDTAEIGEFSDYDLSMEVKMPEDGEDKKGKTENCEIKFRIKRKGEKANINKVKAPYFYLFVLVNASGDYGGRNVEKYSFPKEAALKSKTYDKAEILDKISSYKRPAVYVGSVGRLRTGTGNGGNISKHFGDREIKIPLTGIGKRKILAYHLEVWGEDKIIAEKDWRGFGIKAKNWWVTHRQ